MAVVTVTNTQGLIVGLTPDLMVLLNNTDGQQLVRATRVEEAWTVYAEGQDDVIAGSRGDAFAAMAAHAQAVIGASNYIAQLQPGLSDQP